MAGKLKNYFYRVIAVIAGIIFIVMGINYYIDLAGWNIENGIKTTGVIIKIIENKNDNTIIPNYEYMAYNPVVEFKTPDGKKHKFTELLAGDDKDDYLPGQKVTVKYNSENPLNAKVLHENSFWGIHLILICLGIVFLVISVFIKNIN